jgi:molecular chaperone Hsp33
MERNLMTLGTEDLRHLAADPSGIELECHFCDRRYNFSQSEIEEMLVGLQE